MIEAIKEDIMETSDRRVEPRASEGVKPTFSRHPNDGWVLAEPRPMSKGLRKSLRGLIRAIIPPEPAPQWEGMVDDVEKQVRIILSYMHPTTHWGFRFLVRLFDWAPIWRLRSIRRLRSLPQSRASAILAGVAASRLATLQLLFTPLRAAILSSYFDLDPVHEAIGYAPKEHFRRRLELRHRLMAGEEARPEDHFVPDFEGAREVEH